MVRNRLETLINEEALILAKYLRGEVDMDSKSSAREKIWAARAYSSQLGVDSGVLSGVQ